MILGFNTSRIDIISLEEKLKVYKELGCKAIEFVFVDDSDKTRWGPIMKLRREDLKDFKHISVHAPAANFTYRNNEETHTLLKKLKQLYQQINFTLAVIHPDRVEEWSIFKQYSFPIAIENMDNQKVSYQRKDSLQKIFDQVDVPMVLDLNHCYVNDNTLELAKDLYQAFSDRIKEIHLSGYEPDEIHKVLYKTKQINIIEAIPDKDIPIILEGPIMSVEDMKLEYAYVSELLKSR